MYGIHMCMAISARAKPGEYATPCEPTHAFQDHLLPAWGCAGQWASHPTPEFSFSAYFYFFTALLKPLLPWVRSCQNTVPPWHVLWAKGCVCLTALQHWEANSLTAIKWCSAAQISSCAVLCRHQVPSRLNYGCQRPLISLRNILTLGKYFF